MLQMKGTCLGAKYGQYTIAYATNVIGNSQSWSQNWYFIFTYHMYLKVNWNGIFLLPR